MVEPTSEKTASKSKEELANELRKMIGEEGYRCLAALVFYPDGVKLVSHGVPTLELELSMLTHSIQTLWMRAQAVQQAMYQAALREQKNGVN